MIRFGTEKTITKYRDEKAEQTLRHFVIRVKVNNIQEEMTEYIRFTDDIALYRKQGLLATDKDDSSTRCAFIIDYPKENIDGSYFIIKNYCLVDKIN